MNLETNAIIPSDIKSLYGIDEAAQVRRLAGGLVNETLLVESSQRSFVLRRLAPILGENTIRDTCVIGNHLEQAGWEAPIAVSTLSGDLYATDESGKLWHGLRHINSDTEPSLRHDATLALHAGELLGSWHDTVKTLDHSPTSIPHFHDTDYIANKLAVDKLQLPEGSACELADLFLEDFSVQITGLEGESQIIHGDPKLNNMLFRNGKPFTLIDFDCVLRDSVWTDAGDFLRSISGKLVQAGDNIDSIVDSFITGYVAGSDSKMSADEARYKALCATRRIACELGMRYLSDTVDGLDYFSWDNTTYESRDEALYDKALLQYKVMQIVKESLNEG